MTSESHRTFAVVQSAHSLILPRPYLSVSARLHRQSNDDDDDDDQKWMITDRGRRARGIVR